MSKPVKNLIVKTYQQRFDHVDCAVVFNPAGIKSNQNNELRGNLAKKNIRVTVVSNNLAKRAWQGTALEKLAEMLDGPSAIAYGGDSVVSVARELIAQAKQIEALTFRGALMEGRLFGPEQIEELSKYPTRDEAQAQVVATVLGAGGQLLGAVTSAGSQIASILKALEEKLEKGETVDKVA